MSEIEVKKPLVRVEVKNQQTGEIEILYWEGHVEDFKRKREQTYVIFPRHNLRHVLSYNIGNFEQVTEKTELTQEDVLGTLQESERKKVRERIRIFKANLQREPTVREVQNMVEWVKDPIAYENKYGN